MNWYKVAIEGREVPITPEQFVDMMQEERIALARNESITPETQRLFFTEEYYRKVAVLENLARNRNITTATQRLFFTGQYKRKVYVLHALVNNPSITPEMQRLFFAEEYENKGSVLQRLAENTGILPEVQRLFFTEEYKNHILWYLAGNPSITLETQRLFFTEQYENKYWVLWNLAGNWKFLRNFTRAQWLQIKNAARGGMRLQVLKKRLEQLVRVP